VSVRGRAAACATALLAAAGAGGLAAQVPPGTAQPERPTVATHAGTVAAGWWEVEAGVEADGAFGSASARSYSAPLELKFGVASHVQLTVIGSVQRPAASTLLGDITVGFKWRLLDHSRALGRFAVLPAVTIPTGRSALGAGTGETAGSLLLISSRNLGPMEMDLNLGYTRRAGDGSRAPRQATLWTASFGGPAHGSLGWTAEVYGYPATSGPAGEASLVALLAGPTWTVRPSLVLDTGFIVPLAGPQPRALYAGLTQNLGRLWGPR